MRAHCMLRLVKLHLVPSWWKDLILIKSLINLLVLKIPSIGCHIDYLLLFRSYSHIICKLSHIIRISKYISFLPCNLCFSLISVCLSQSWPSWYWWLLSNAIVYLLYLSLSFQSRWPIILGCSYSNLSWVIKDIYLLRLKRII
jgi:hypothetical protein